jgi:hypothetical protein
MKGKTKILKINSDGFLVEWNDKLNRFELTNRSWNWSDITPGYIRESKRNYKTNNN